MFTVEGMGHMLDVVVHDAAKVSQWYMAPFVNDATLVETLTAATFPSTCGEATTQYVEGARPAYNEGAASGGVTNNAGNESTITAAPGVTVTLYGMGLTSVATKGATSGILLQVGKFPYPITLHPGEKVDLSAQQQVANA